MREVLLRRVGRACIWLCVFECMCLLLECMFMCVCGCGCVNIYFETRQVLRAIGIEIGLWLLSRTWNPTFKATHSLHTFPFRLVWPRVCDTQYSADSAGQESCHSRILLVCINQYERRNQFEGIHPTTYWSRVWVSADPDETWQGIPHEEHCFLMHSTVNVRR